MKLNDLDLNKLKAFAAAFRGQSVKAAAAELHVTPSAVSQALKALESNVSSKLFVRCPNKLIPTEDGKLLFRKVSPFLADMESFLTNGYRDKKEPVGILRVGAPVEFGSHVVLDQIVAFRKRHPKVSFNMIHGVPVKILAALLNGDLDIAFVDDGPYWDTFQSVVATEPLFEEDLELVCSDDIYQQSFLSVPDYKKLITLPHITYLESGAAVKMWYKHHFGKAPAQLKTSFVSENVQAIIRACQSSLGLAMIPDHLASPDIELGILRKISIEPALTNRILLARLKDKVPNLAERLFVDQFRKKHS